MSKATVNFTRTQGAYYSAMSALGFKGGLKKDSLSMSRDFANFKVAVKITSDTSVKIITTEYLLDGTPKETTQTFFPPASEFSTGVVMNQLTQIVESAK